MTVVWKDPPPKPRSWETRLEPLVSEPSRWAFVYKAPTEGTARGVVGRLNKRVYRIPRPDDQWEFEHRGLEVYARYIGTQSTHLTTPEEEVAI